jgi:uncharacterized protein with PQ loop repeat
MATPWFAKELPQHCTPTTPFLHDLSLYFHTCVPTPLAALSTLLGTLSIVSWLFAQMPQIYKNYKIQSTAGLSAFFLIEWLLGDTTNLLGALFTKQATWQVIIASYYVFVDMCLVIQWAWYTHLKRKIYQRSLHSSASSNLSDADSDIIRGLSPIRTSFREPDVLNKKDTDDANKTQEPSRPINTPQFSEVKYEKGTLNSASVTRITDKASASWAPMPSPRTVLFIATVCAIIAPTQAAPTPFLPPQHNRSFIHLFRIDTPLEVAGTILSWCSTLLYLFSRLPQLYHNWTRQSTAGLSPLLFMAAFSGNFFYSTSLLTNPNAWNDFGSHGGHGWAGEEGSDHLQWIARAAPFFLGAAGVLVMDACMGAQFLMYNEKNEEKLVKVRASDGTSHWERVSGWMRGWVPSLQGKERVVDLSESQRLLSRSREMARSRRASTDLDRIRSWGEREYGTV